MPPRGDEHVGCKGLYSVGRANYITLVFVLVVAAVQILPKRLANAHFLASWLHSLLAVFGLT